MLTGAGMRDSLIDLVCCPVTRSPLTLDSDASRSPAGEILRGTLRSPEGRTYAVAGGIPHLYEGFRSADEEQTVKAFGTEWAKYDDHEGYMGSPDLFREFTGLDPSQIAGRRVLEVGCGGGRWLKVLAGLGAREVVGLDFSTAVEQARARTAALPDVHVVRGSALQMPLRPAFDLVVSIGVVHHLDDPIAGLRGMRAAAAPGALAVIWVYAQEGNELYLRVARPLRQIGPKLPSQVLSLASKGLASGLWVWTHTVNRAAVSLRVPLPLRDYLAMLSRLRFRDLESVTYDQLTPSLARYPSKAEVSGWVESAGGAIDRLFHRTSNSWQCHFRFPDAQAHGR
jgi:SAM-dependent methyltransferase